MYISNYCFFRIKNRLKRFFLAEQGGAEIIATVVIIGIVLVIAFLFRTAIKDLFISLWNNFVVGNSDGNGSTIEP